MTSRRSGPGFLLAMVIGLTCTATHEGVALGEEPKVFRLTIASQPLADALEEFARQSGVQVIFFSELTDGSRAPALDGSFTLSQALTLLLTNTTLTFRIVNARTVKVEHRHDFQ
jgi:hypothetical protein